MELTIFHRWSRPGTGTTTSPVLEWRRHGNAVMVVAVFVSALGLFSVEWFHDIQREGVSTVGAERILNGELPYRDFWTMYAPGQFYFVALLFTIFGRHLIVEVIGASIVCAAAACACYRLSYKLLNHRLAALLPVVVFLAAIYNTGYFKRLGSYPPAILFILVSLNFLLSYYRDGRLGHLLAAGLATGMAVAFKHDVGGYTAIAIVAGLIAYHSLTQATTSTQPSQSLFLKLSLYFVGVIAIPLPALTYLWATAGKDFVTNLIAFPATDFRFARPEGYPSLFPFGVYDPSLLKTLQNLSNYLNFSMPFGLFLLGLVGIGLALKSRNSEYGAMLVTFSTGYLLHWQAAHVQINTHIVTMSAYAACSAVLFLTLVDNRAFDRPLWDYLTVFFFVWILSLAAKPAYTTWDRSNGGGVTLKLPKVSGFTASPNHVKTLTELTAFVHRQIPPGTPLFVGLHRHDVVIVGDVMSYFILDRPSATRYHELHPAVTDTTPVQQEMIRDLQRKKVPLLVLKDIFSDQALEPVKQNFLRRLPHIGATDLDSFIRANYVEVRKFGPYRVWTRKASLHGQLESRSEDHATNV